MEKHPLQKYEVIGARFELVSFERGLRRSKTFTKGQQFDATPDQIPYGFRDLVREVMLPEDVSDLPEAEAPVKKGSLPPPFRRRG